MTRGVPTVRPISWIATIPQLVAGATVIAVAWMITGSATMAFIYGPAAYLIYSFGSRLLLAAAHRRGIKRMHQHCFAEAIPEFEASYKFFSRYRWLDDYRSIFMMSPAAMSYREMALVNIAFAYSQLGDGVKTVESYRRALSEFPDNQTAQAAMRLIESVAGPQPQ